MSLQIFVRQFARVPLKGDKVAKVTFRGVSLFTRVVEEEGDDVLFDEVLEWPMGRPLDPNEVVDIQLQIYNRYFSNKVAASYGLVLHRLVSEGHIAITDHMTDANNKVIKTRLAFEARYTSPANKKLEQARRAEGSRSSSKSRGGEGDHGDGAGRRVSRDSSECDEGARTRDSSIDSFSRENEKESLIRGRTNSSFFSSTTKRLTSFTSERKRTSAIDSGQSAPPVDVTKKHSVRHSERSKSSKGDSLSRKSRRDSATSRKKGTSLGRGNTEDEGQPVASAAATGGQVGPQKHEQERDKPTQSKTLLDNDEDDSSDDQRQFQFPVSGKTDVEPAPAAGKNEDIVVVAQSRKASSVRASDSDQDEKQMLLNVEQNIANLEKSMSMQERISASATKNRSKDSSPDTPRKSRGFSTGMKAVRSLVRLGRQRSKSAGNTTDEEEKWPLQPAQDTQPTEGFAQPPSRPHSVCSTQSENDSSASAAPAAQPAKK